MKNPALSVLALAATLALASCGNTDGSGPTVAKTIASPVFGSQAAPVSLTIYSDYQCPACQVFHELHEKKLHEDYVDTGKVRVTYKNFPLDMHANARRDALAGLCGAEQNKYREYSEALFDLEEEREGRRVMDADRTETAKKAGLDEAAFAQCLTENRYVGQVQNEYDEAVNKNLGGTPSFVIDEATLDLSNYDDLFRALDAKSPNAGSGTRTASGEIY